MEHTSGAFQFQYIRDLQVTELSLEWSECAAPKVKIEKRKKSNKSL